MQIIEVVREVIVPEILQQRLNNISHGAIVSFCGQVRLYNLNKKVIKIIYQIAKPLTMTFFNMFIQQARQQWELLADIVLVHRCGMLKVGEISMVVMVSCKHRREAFLINQYLIEKIKEQAPIWKKEYYVSGESQWVKGHALCKN